MVHVLWDASDIWGPLAVWGLRGLGVSCRIVRAAEVADGILDADGATLLFVPGGFARHKSEALGPAGRAAIRAFTHGGGMYMGFCGGAGLALTGDASLGICPWRRAGYANRIQHHMSGHFYMAGDGFRKPGPRADRPGPLLPVWWPGRFAPEKDGNVTVLATYDTPGPDFWLADLPVADLPSGAFADWEAKYGFSPSPLFLRGEPCVIGGTHGAGRYLLSYSHLETPESPDANAWLAGLLAESGGENPRRSCVPAWDLDSVAPAWDDPDLLAVWDGLSAVLDAGRAAGLFFARSSWLLGWRAGLPGAVCNTLRAHLHAVLSLPPAREAEEYWARMKASLTPAFGTFSNRATSYLLAERLAMTLSKDLPDALAPESLQAERAAVFGAPGMAARADGLLRTILPVLDELAFLQLRDAG